MGNKHNVNSILSHKNVETTAILKAAIKANKQLAELKGVAASMPNPYILIGMLSLQEAKESSEIESIITTHDDIYRSDYKSKIFINQHSKEVHNYAQALQEGYKIVSNKGLLSTNTIKQIQQTLEENDAGFRTQAGTALKDELTGKVIYTPPQHGDDIVKLMSELELFINDNESSDADDLVKMALIHHQFESIHPFYDGNGRTGRIINILYLVKQGLLDTPILYLSRYINQNKSSYYHLLQSVPDENNWQDWILFILTGVEQTARQTVQLIQQIKGLMQQYKVAIKEHYPKIYSHELLNNLFKHPYTKIEFLEQDIGMSRQTCAKYLDALEKIDLVSKHKMGKENYYINKKLFALLQQPSTINDK